MRAANPLPPSRRTAGEPRSRGLQLWRALYHGWPLLEDLAPTVGTPNGFSAGFVDRLNRVASLDGGMQVESVHTAPDGTQKLACRLTSGQAAGMEVGPRVESWEPPGGMQALRGGPWVHAGLVGV